MNLYKNEQVLKSMCIFRKSVEAVPFFQKLYFKSGNTVFCCILQSRVPSSLPIKILSMLLLGRLRMYALYCSGRAWLLMALNECLLESYLRCYQTNDKLVEDFYVRDALVRDREVSGVALSV